MSSPIDKIPIKNRLLDRRVKLTDDDRVEIIRLFNDGMAIRAIARLFDKVSRRLIQFIIYPERIKKQDSSQFYDKEKHKQYMRKHRAYKRELLKGGKI